MLLWGGKSLPTTIVQHFKSPLAPLKSLFLSLFGEKGDLDDLKSPSAICDVFSLLKYVVLKVEIWYNIEKEVMTCLF